MNTSTVDNSRFRTSRPASFRESRVRPSFSSWDLKLFEKSGGRTSSESDGVIVQISPALKMRFGSECEDVNRYALPKLIPSELRLPDVAKPDFALLLVACVPAQIS